MATVLQECITDEQNFVVRFLWARELNANNIHKEIFPVYGGKCLSRIAVQNLAEKSSRGRSKITDDADQAASC
jgi:hypothetical protein